MVTATYQTLIDWVGNGAFTGSSDDVTGKVIFMEWVRGRQFASQLTGKALGGVANIHLNNDGGTFSTQNNSSPLTGSLLPGRAIRIRSTAPSTTVLWEGKLDVLENRVSLDNAHVAVVKAIGPLALVQQRNVRVPMTTSTLTGVLINRILDDVNWPTGSRSIDAGQTTVTYYWTENKPALEALREVEDTEAGYIGESKDGKIVFEDRDHRLSGTHITSQATFTDNSTGTLFFFMVEQDDPLKAIYNTFEAEISRFTTGTSTVLWVMAQTGSASPLIRNGAGTLRVEAQFPNKASSPTAVAVVSWTALSATTDYTVNTQADGAGTDITANIVATLGGNTFGQSATILLTNNDAQNGYVTTLQVRGVPLLTEYKTNVRVEDSTSQTSFGRKTYRNPAPHIPTVEEGNDWGAFQVSIYKDALQIIHLSVNANRDSTHMTQVLERDISDQITVNATGRSDLGFSNIFFVEHEHHRITADRTHWVTWDLSPATGYGGFWVLNTSELGTRTRLGY